MGPEFLVLESVGFNKETNSMVNCHALPLAKQVNFRVWSWSGYRPTGEESSYSPQI